MFVAHYSQPRVAGQIEVARIWADDGGAPVGNGRRDLVTLAGSVSVPQLRTAHQDPTRSCPT